MCTSSSTTSGSGGRDGGDRLGDGAGLAHDVDMRAQFRAYSGPEHRVVVDQEHPQPPRAPVRRCLMSHLLLGAVLRAFAGLIGMDSRTSVPSPGSRANLRLAAVSLHPPDDRAAYAMAVVVDRFRVEADAPVPDEYHDLLRLDLRVERDGRDLGVPAGVDQSLPCRRRPAPPTRSSTSASPTTTVSTLIA